MERLLFRELDILGLRGCKASFSLANWDLCEVFWRFGACIISVCF